MGLAFAVMSARGVADLPPVPTGWPVLYDDNVATYLHRLTQHCDHIGRRCTEIAQLLETMLAVRDGLAGLEAEFDRLAPLLDSEDTAISDSAVRAYSAAMNTKAALHGNLEGVLSEAITVKFASISYTLSPTTAAGRDRPALTSQIERLEARRDQPGQAFSPQEQAQFDALKRQRNDQRTARKALRKRRGEDLSALFADLTGEISPFLARDARDQIVHLDERIDTNEAHSPQASFAYLPPAKLTALRDRMVQLSADSKAVSAGIWRFCNRLPGA